MHSYLQKCLYRIAKGLNATVRFQVAGLETLKPAQPYLYCVWHGYQFSALRLFPSLYEKQLIALVSPSRDGRLLAGFLNQYGIETVHGSSSKQGFNALRDLLRYIKAGKSIVITPDGPRGPREIVKTGIVFLAQKSSLPIIPIGCAYANAWTLSRAWDRFQVPKPFSQVSCYIGQPLIMDSNKSLEEMQSDLQAAMEAAQISALRNGPFPPGK